MTCPRLYSDISTATCLIVDNLVVQIRLCVFFLNQVITKGKI